MSKEIPASEKPWSEKYRIIAKKWVDAESAAELMKELKETSLEGLKAKVMQDQGGSMSDAAAQRMAMNQPEWKQYIEDLCEHRANARKYKVQLKYIEMKYGEQQSYEATARKEMRL